MRNSNSQIRPRRLGPVAHGRADQCSLFSATLIITILESNSDSPYSSSSAPGSSTGCNVQRISCKPCHRPMPESHLRNLKPCLCSPSETIPFVMCLQSPDLVSKFQCLAGYIYISSIFSHSITFDHSSMHRLLPYSYICPTTAPSHPV